MDPKPPRGEMWLAPPPPGSSAALRLPSARELPPVDEHLVRPETREQLVRGRQVLAMPALAPHGDRHFKLDYVIGAHVKEGYVGSTDLLTRTGARSDFATDTCIRRDGIDPSTNTRYLEELAFEVVNEQSVRDVTDQAEDLTARGVRRIVAFFVKKGEVCEWSPQTSTWKKLDPEGGRKEGHQEGHKEGHKEGLVSGIETACDLLGIDLTEGRRAWMDRADAPELAALLTRLRTDRRWP